jgi:hypothetical protein
MAHNPVNHPLRPLYRTLGFLAGAYLVVFGIVGLVNSGDLSFAGLNSGTVFGLGSSTLWSIISIILGAIVVLATVVGRNVDVAAERYVGWALIVLGGFGLATSRTDANAFGFTIGSVIVAFIVGIVLVLSSLYSKVVPTGRAGAPRQVREGQVREGSAV